MPDVFFDGLAYLLPALNGVAEECGISIGQWIILWHLFQNGLQNENGETIMLRQDLTDLLVKRGFGEANIVRLLNSLEDKRLVRRLSLSQTERQRFFSSSEGGNRQAVAVHGAGYVKIGQFKEAVSSRFERWRAEQPAMLKSALATAKGAGLQVAALFPKSKKSS